MSWYDNKIKKESVGDRYGSWLSPEGKLHPVGLNQHTDSALDVMKANSWKLPPRVIADDFLLGKKYAKITHMGGLCVHHKLGLSNEQIKIIKNLFEAEKRINNSANVIINNPEFHDKRVSDSMDLHNHLRISKVTSLNKNSSVLKRVMAAYGHWTSPIGELWEVGRGQGHHKLARKILLSLGVNPEEIDSKLPSTDLLDLGWAKSAFRSNEMTINSYVPLTGPQVESIVDVANNVPGNIEMYRVNVPGASQYLMRKQLSHLEGVLNVQKPIVTSSNGRVIKTANSELDKFMKQHDSLIINPRNQVGSFSSLHDVQRYVMDSYNTKTALSKTKNKITVSVLTTHAFLGSVAYNKYWSYDLGDYKDAIKAYKAANKIVEETVEEFVDDEIPTTIFWPILKHKLDKIQPGNNAATNIPWVNYSRAYEEDDNPDWRQNIYGNRYPKYSEPSYDQEIRRTGVFFD